MALIFIVALIAPGTVFFYLSPWGIRPDLMMLWLIYLSLYSQPRGALLGAFVMGFLTDLYMGSAIGHYTFTLCATALICIRLQKGWDKGRILPVTALVLAVTLAGQTIMVLLAALAGAAQPLAATVKVVLGVSLYNTLLTPLTFPLVRRLFVRRIFRAEPLYPDLG
ncbi:MAG: rod shape-determining protein MreD [Peptococcaceae bacterium]|nr:rod shape-determining protein MreD [Peptococcaceae bacterium]